jgi:hypothetical protein
MGFLGIIPAEGAASDAEGFFGIILGGRSGICDGAVFLFGVAPNGFADDDRFRSSDAVVGGGGRDAVSDGRYTGTVVGCRAVGAGYWGCIG